MCGRYYWKRKYDLDRKSFIEKCENPFEAPPNFNVAPTQEAPIIRIDPVDGKSELLLSHWGLIPSWAKDRKLSFKMINARSETAAVKPAFRGPFKKKRCLVPADGYYEWIMTENGKLPYAIYPSDEDTFYMAGLWDCWKSPEGLMVLSFTILTRAADPQVEHLHHRMPVILDDQTQEAWIDPNLQDPQELESLLDYTKPTDLRFHPISTLVNSVRNNGPELIEPRS